MDLPPPFLSAPPGSETGWEGRDHVPFSLFQDR